MMNKEFFKTAISKIENFYDKNYNELQIEEIYKYFSKYNDKRFSYISSLIFQKCKYLPNLSEMILIDKEIPYTQITEEQKIKCDKCKGTGFILYYKKAKGTVYQYIAHCNCVNGNKWKYDGRNLKDTQRTSNYYVPSIVEIGLI